MYVNGNNIAVYKEFPKEPFPFVRLSKVGNRDISFASIEDAKKFNPIVIVCIFEKGNQILLNDNELPSSYVLDFDAALALIPNGDCMFIESVKRIGLESGVRVDENSIKLLGVAETDATYYFYKASIDHVYAPKIDSVKVSKLTKEHCLGLVTLEDFY